MIWIALPFVLWVFFLAYSALWINRSVLRIEVKLAGLVVIVIGALIDVGLNWTLGLLLGVTRDLMFSQKCGRLKQGDDWRARAARYICNNWLDPFMLGGHCR